MNTERYILCFNAGSSSVKAAVTQLGDTERTTTYEINTVTDYPGALRKIIEHFQSSEPSFSAANVVAIGHRIVHGGPQSETARIIDEQLQSDIESYAEFDPQHTPTALAIISACRQMFATATQVACFDTAFFHTLPVVAQTIALPQRFAPLGIRKYGFHGLSYQYLLSELTRHYSPATQERIVFAHLGSGASLAAVAGGVPIDTTMSFTPASGIVMSSRSGDLDPSIVSYIHKRTGLTFEDWERVVNTESGLLGVSDDSGDMYTLLQHERASPGAAAAVELFVYRVRKAIGEMTAAMGGVDRLVFSGGIGEQSSILRERIVTELDYLGFRLDAHANQAVSQSDTIISTRASKPIHVIHTDENAIIIDHIKRLITQ